MPARRTIAALLAVLLVAGGFPLVVGTPAAATPALELENEDDTTYRVTAYTVADRHTAMHVNYRVTTRDGDRRLATLSQLVWPGGFRNVTLADDGIPAQRITLDPGENLTTRIEGWTHGDVTIYIAEDLGDNSAHVQTEIKTCPVRGQEHGLSFSDGTAGGYSVCASGFDWMLP